MALATTQISLQTKIAYPRSISVGETYLLSIDLDHDVMPEDWPYASEEYPVTCLVDAAPYFIQKAESDATVIVSRFGGSYGPARFWLTARKGLEKLADASGAGPTIDVLLVNASGMPIHRVLLDEIELRDRPVVPPGVDQDEPVRELGQVPTPRPDRRQRAPTDGRTFRWMHLSDLHFRGGSHEERPRVASEACAWVESTGSPIHAIIVSGDITYSGQPSQFEQAAEFFHHLISSLADAQGEVPRLLVVPGNHDFQRNRTSPLPIDAPWNLQSPQRQRFWADSRRRQDHQRGFEAFTLWRLRMEALGGNSPGVLPGDFASDMEFDGLKVGIVGLNDCALVSPEGSVRADVHPVQLQTVCGEMGSWSLRHDLRILVTHHAPESLMREISTSFYRTFAPRALFDLHLFGTTSAASPPLRINEVNAQTQAALPAARLNGHYPQGFRIGEASVSDRTVSVRLHRFDVPRSGAGLGQASEVATLNKRSPLTPFDADAIEDNVVYVVPAPALSTQAVGKRRAMLVGLSHVKVGERVATQALSRVLTQLGFQMGPALHDSTQRTEIVATLHATLREASPHDLLIYFCVETPRNSEQRAFRRPSRDVTSDELFEVARGAGRRLLIIGDIAPATRVPPGCGIIRRRAMEYDSGPSGAFSRYGVSAVVNALRASLDSNATIGELCAGIGETWNANRRRLRVWVRAVLTEEVANLTLGVMPRIESKTATGAQEGYDPEFLGFSAPLPGFTQPERIGPLLHYVHFSVLLNTERQMAWFGAVNVDFMTRLKDDDEIDWERWRYESRVPRSVQLAEEVFRHSLFDHARLVKRMMPAWGEPSLAARAFSDTGHYTNLMPLMSAANQNPIWRALPDHILKYRASRQRMSFFSGPLFSKLDPKFRGVRIPTGCWMVIAYADEAGRPTSVAFVTWQLDGQGTPTREAPVFQTDLPEEAHVARVSIDALERLTGLDFLVLRDLDVSADESQALESRARPGIKVTSLTHAIPRWPVISITEPAPPPQRPKRSRTRAKRK